MLVYRESSPTQLKEQQKWDIKLFYMIFSDDIRQAKQVIQHYHYTSIQPLSNLMEIEPLEDVFFPHFHPILQKILNFRLDFINCRTSFIQQHKLNQYPKINQPALGTSLGGP